VVQELSEDIEHALARLDPAVQPMSRELLWECAHRWTAYFNDAQLADGVGYLTKLLGCRGVDLSLDDEDPNHPGIRFALHSSGNLMRDLLLSWEPVVHLATYGEPLSFEDLAAYAAREPAQRLTVDRVIDYATQLGVHAASPTFYLHRGVLFTDARKRPKPVPSDTPEASFLRRAFGVSRVIRRQGR
jgi:hypothetical protein